MTFQRSISHSSISRSTSNLVVSLLVFAALMAAAGCSDGPAAPEPPSLDGSLDMQITRTSAATLPDSVDRVKLRAWNGSTDRVVDIEIPDEGETRQVEIPVPKGAYSVGLLTYNPARGEAYGFADSVGVEIEPKLPTNLDFTIGEITSGPDYLLSTELQVKTTFPPDIEVGTFFTAPDLHPNLPPATLLYDPQTFLTDAGFSAAMQPELDAYYIAYADSILTPAFADSVFFRVKTPVRSEWGAEGATGLAVYAPSVSKGEPPFSFALDGSIIVTFIEQMKARGRFDN